MSHFCMKRMQSRVVRIRNVPRRLLCLNNWFRLSYCIVSGVGMWGGGVHIVVHVCRGQRTTLFLWDKFPDWPRTHQVDQASYPESHRILFCLPSQHWVYNPMPSHQFFFYVGSRDWTRILLLLSVSFPYQTETKSLSKVSLLLVTCLGYSAAAMVEESSSMEHSRDGMEEGEGTGENAAHMTLWAVLNELCQGSEESYANWRAAVISLLLLNGIPKRQNHGNRGKNKLLGWSLYTRIHKIMTPH